MDGSSVRRTFSSEPPPLPPAGEDAPVLYNWKRDICYQPAVVVKVRTVDEIVSVVQNEAYPSPVRVKGSHHSVTECVVAQGGTVLDVSGMNQIMQVDRAAMTVTMQAGVQLKDAAEVLEKLGLQFYVNVELGNLTVGSGACCGTKKASFYVDGEPEYGQVSSYVESFKVVTTDGSLLTVDSSNPTLLEAMRSSYGLLGVVYEVTYKIKKLGSMKFEHTRYRLDEFAEKIDELAFGDKSCMLYIFPFIDRVVIERRWSSEEPIERCNDWWFRNFAWKAAVPFLGRVGRLLPTKAAQSVWLDGVCWAVALILPWVKGDGSSPVDQIMRYSEHGGLTAYTFSLWAFEKRSYLTALHAYVDFCKEHYRTQHYRCDMPSVGYAVAQDRSALFSYSRAGHSLTLDPVSTGGEGWKAFLDAFNELCSSKQGKPLFNQTPQLKHQHVRAAFPTELGEFLALRKQLDQRGRFYTRWFKAVLEGEP